MHATAPRDHRPVAEEQQKQQLKAKRTKRNLLATTCQPDDKIVIESNLKFINDSAQSQTADENSNFQKKKKLINKTDATVQFVPGSDFD